MASTALRDKKIAVGLILIMLFGFYVTSITVEYVQAADHGYGSGFSHQYHVSPSVVKVVAAEDHLSIPAHISAAALSNLTLGNHGHGLWHDTWRWLLTLIAFGLLLWFWYAVCSRIGSI